MVSQRRHGSLKANKRVKRFLLLTLLLFLLGLVSPLEGPGIAEARERYIGTSHFVRISERLKPSVVNLILTRHGELQKGPFHLLFDKLFGKKRIEDVEDFFSYVLFQESPQRMFTEKMVGSGVVIRSDGLILTNEHVISKNGSLEVILSDGRAFPAQIVGTDYLTDLAIVKIEAEGLPKVRFGDSEKLRVGEWVLAIGNSLGLHYTVSAGIVSAKGRKLFEEGVRPYSNMIQTDAPINLGNSGGPLVNMKGEVVGINTSIIPEGQSIGFAVPINGVKEILPDLIEKGKVTRSWVGIVLRSGEDGERRFVIERLFRDGPGEKAGLRVGDKILAINDMRFETEKEIHEFLRKTKIGSKVTFWVERNGETLPIEVLVESLPIPRFKWRKTYPPGFKGFILRLPERTRWLLITGAVLSLVLLIAVRRDMMRRSRRATPREKDRRAEERRQTHLPIEEIRVAAERRKSERRQSDRRQKKQWFRVS